MSVLAQTTVKKGTFLGRIKNEIRRTLRQEAVWTHIIPCTLLRQYEKDVGKKVLPVKGTKAGDIDFPLMDVLALFNHIDLNIHDSKIAKKLKDQPMFSTPERNITPEEELGIPVFEHYHKQGTYNMFVENYEFKHERHIARQQHKINGYFHYDKWTTFAMLLDMSLDFLAENSIKRLYQYLYDTLITHKYSRIDPSGVYSFILHLTIRGVAIPTNLTIDRAWRRTWNLRSKLEQIELLKHFTSGEPFSDVDGMQESYIQEVAGKLTMLRREIKLIRSTYKPDERIFNPDYVFYATFYHGIYKQMTDVQRHRAALNMTIYHYSQIKNEIKCTCNNNRMIREGVLSGRIEPSKCLICDYYDMSVYEPTMFKSAATTFVQDTIAESGPAVTKIVNDTLTDPDTIANMQNMASVAAKPVIAELTSRVEELKNKTVEELKNTVEPVMAESMGTFSALNGILSFLKDTMNSVTNMIPVDLLGKIGIKIDMDTLLHVFKYYILYINTDSTFIKSCLFLLIVKQLGVFDILKKFGTTILAWMKFDKVVEESTVSNVEPTGAMDWVQTIMNMFSGHLPEITICTFITLALTIVFKLAMKPNVPLSRKDHASVHSSILDGFKNIHFIGAGMFGFERIIKYLNLIGTTLTKWISKYIFGTETDERKNEKAVSIWYGKLQYFKTEAGRAAIRVSEKTMKMAEQIQPEGLAFIHGVASDPKFLSRESAQLVQRSQKDASDLASFCYRIRAMSNFQPAMFHIQFVGDAGVGKSKLTEEIIQRLHKELYPPDQKLSYYSYNPNIDHFDGYQQQKFMIIDDLFRYNEPKHMSLLIGLVTNTPVMLPMAHLEEKGIQLNSDILVSSTNVPYPEAKDLFCMEAVHRRRHVLVEVYVNDRSVMDEANSKFDGEKYKKSIYGQKGIPSTEFPHLRFNLLKPVVKPTEDMIRQTTLEEEETYYANLNYYQKLNRTHNFSENEYYSRADMAPSGVSFPCKDWTFEQLIKNIAGRYASLRKHEGKLSLKEKFSQVMDSFTEIDAIQHQTNQTNSNYSLDTTLPLVAKQYLNMTYAYGCDDPLGERIYLKENNTDKTQLGKLSEIPELDDIELFENELKTLINDEEQPTMKTEDTESIYMDSETRLDYLDLLSEYITKHNPQGHTLTKIQSLIRSFETNHDVEDLSFEERELLDDILDDMDSGCNWDLQKEIATERLAEHHDNYRSEIARKAEAQRKLFEEEMKNKDSTSEWITYKRQKRFIIHIKDTYQNELDALSCKATTSAGANGTIVEPMIDPIHFAKSLIFKERIEKLQKAGKLKPILARKIQKFLQEADNPKSCTMIPRSNHFSQKMQGTQTVIPRSWFKRMIKVEGNWVLDVTDLYFEDDSTESATFKSKHAITQLLLSQLSFTLAMQQFAMFTRVQQDFLVKHNHWILKYLPDITGSSWRGIVKKIFDKIKNVTMTYLFSPLQYFWNAISAPNSPYLKIIQHTMMFVVGIMCIKQVSTLLKGKDEPTSKVMHRVATRSVPRGGKFQPTGAFPTQNTDSQLCQVYLDRNIRFIELIDKSGIPTKCHAIHIEQFLLVNRHMVEGVGKEMVEINFCPTPRHTDRWSFMINEDNIYKAPRSDAAIIFCRRFPMAKDISRHFITEADYEHLDTSLEMISLSRYEEEAMIEIRTGGVIEQNLFLSNEDLGISSHLCRALRVAGQTITGKSGAMLIVPNKASGHRNILGIQAWRLKSYTKPEIYYQIITSEMFEDMKSKVIAKANYPYISQTGPVIVEPTGTSKSEYLVEHHVEICGSVPADKVVGKVGKTSFRKTPIAMLMERDGCKSDRVPAALNEHDRRLNVKEHPLKNSINKCGRGIVGPFDIELLTRASQDLAYWFKDRLDKKKFRTDLSFEECVTGVREEGSNPVDCRASPGIPYIWDKYPGKLPGKKSMIQINEEGNTEIIDPEYPPKFEKFFESLQKGVIPPHTSYDFPKDELRPEAKALGDPVAGTPPKTRSVTCMSLDIILAWRRVTCDLFASLHRAARGNFPFAPGMNPEGPDWGRLFNWLNVFPHIVDFDVSNWDGHMTADLMMAVADMLCIMLGVSPHSPEAKVIYAIVTEVIFGHVQFEDLVYHKLRGLISGFPGTAETNTLAHILLFYYFYLYLARINNLTHLMNIHTFMRHVHAIFYGDDVQASISEFIISWFNGQTIAWAYEQHGYPVTDAAKGKEIQKSKNIMDSQFLKSSFNPISPARIDRKLDINVVYDMFYWVRAKEHPKEQFLSNVHDAFRVLHGHGLETYEAVRNQFNGWMREIGEEPFSVYWHDFERSHIENYYAE